MEKKLRMKLEEELREFREAAAEGSDKRRHQGSAEDMEDLRRKISEQDEKVGIIERRRGVEQVEGMILGENKNWCS